MFICNGKIETQITPGCLMAHSFERQSFNSVRSVRQSIKLEPIRFLKLLIGQLKSDFILVSRTVYMEPNLQNMSMFELFRLPNTLELPNSIQILWSLLNLQQQSQSTVQWSRTQFFVVCLSCCFDWKETGKRF